MSNTFQDLVYTQFPDQTEDRYEYLQDLNLNSYPLAKQYETLLSQNKFNEANELLKNNPELNRIMLNAEKYNRLIDSIRGTQRLFSQSVQKYIAELVKNKGTFSKTTRYEKYDVVFYGGDSMAYLCTDLNTPIGTLPTNNNYWYPLSIKGDKGDNGENGLGLHFKKRWSANDTYSKDAAVTYNTSLYASKVDNNKGHTPSNKSDYWELVINFDEVSSYDNSSTNIEANTFQDAIDIAINNTKDINNRISNVDNTHDSEKNVKYAESSGSSSYDSGGYHIHDTFDQIVNSINGINGTLNNKLDTSASCNKNWNWNGQGGQPSWVWGGENGADMYVYNPSNFNVKHANYASFADNSDSVDSIHVVTDVHDRYGLRSISMDTFALEPGVSIIAPGTIYIQYE